MAAVELELLSPARNADTGMAAIDCGADAVYIGGPGFGARANAKNSFDDIERLTAYARRFHVRTFMTLNTLVFDSELEKAREIAWEAWRRGVDALIVQDMGLLEMDLPPIALHASTQCDIRTPEKAAFLEACGMRQMVLARELTLEEIAAVHARVQKARLEYFVHGALCVSYSGQCYLSMALAGKSANRGRCLQPCRHAYDVYDYAGRLLAGKSHVLSLKDNDQSANLEELVEAGVRSFKIEGRLKDASYVRNVTAHYRGKIDALLARHPDWAKTSLGVCDPGFSPDPDGTFRRSATDYFAHGRQEGIAELASPKSTGRCVGEVLEITGRNAFAAKLSAPVVNGDGLTVLAASGEPDGFAANVVVERGGTAEIRLHEPLAAHPGVVPAAKLYRNRDSAFLKTIQAARSRRAIPCVMTLAEGEGGLELCAEAAGLKRRREIGGTFAAANDPEKGRQAIDRALSRTGGTVFEVARVRLELKAVPFVPVSVLNEARRAVLAELEKAVAASHPAQPPAARKAVTFASPYADFRLNVANRLARAFWEKHGVRVTQMAFEIRPEGLDPAACELMRTRHCVRHALGLCPRSVKGDAKAKARFKEMNAGHLKPEPLVLVNPDGARLVARFDCRACEMTVSLAG